MNEPAEKLLPHQPPMRLLTALVECTETSATATAQFGADDYAVADGFVTEAALVECVAQTVAAAQRYRARANGPMDRNAGGMLASVSGFKINSRPAAGKPLRIEVRELKRFGPMLSVAGVITSDGQVVASGELILNA